MTLPEVLLAALVQWTHFLTPFRWEEVHTVEEMIDTHNVYPCHLLRTMGCGEGQTPECWHDLRTKWRGPACYSRDGKAGGGPECGDCVLMYATEDGKADGRGRRGIPDIREFCGIPCRYAFFFQ